MFRGVSRQLPASGPLGSSEERVSRRLTRDVSVEEGRGVLCGRVDKHCGDTLSAGHLQSLVSRQEELEKKAKPVPSAHGVPNTQSDGARRMSRVPRCSRHPSCSLPQEAPLGSGKKCEQRRGTKQRPRVAQRAAQPLSVSPGKALAEVQEALAPGPTPSSSAGFTRSFTATNPSWETARHWLTEAKG